MKRVRVPRVMATRTRVAGNKEGNGDGSKSNANGDNTDDDKDNDYNNDRDGWDSEPVVHNIVISATSSTHPLQPQQ
jgi:hypothetical protein